ncbi:uncharacterized protein LOC122033889 [Zingiber officinale]|uniref:uncharacterized protein LOC122033889 n=1 Tax=Zingiber officinale TaxID=94328 RepID=UPI001C4C5FCE|nr:uncharacterized protein LOC122033889 [Zingiber officinale]
MDGQFERVIQILEDLLRACMMDFKGNWESKLPLIEFTYNNIYQATIGMTPYEALYGRKCRTPLHWEEVTERAILGLDIVTQTVELVEKIRNRMQAVQSRQKSYADQRRRDLEVAIGDHGWNSSLLGCPTPKFVQGTQCVPVSMLRRYISNPSHVISHESMQWTPDLTYEERPKQIRDRQVQKLRNKEIKMVKILWGNHQMEEATWETEQDMHNRYPELFGNSNFEDEIFLRVGEL